MEYSKGTYKIGAIVVVYNPNTDLLKNCIASLVSQVDCVCVVDNSAFDNSAVLSTLGDNIHYIPLLQNKGIAAAQNFGIKFFCEKAYDFVIFSDQDSVSSTSLIRNIVEAYFVLSKETNIACIGPMPINRKTGLPYIYERSIIERCERNGIKYYKMYSIISSYSLFPTHIFSEIGTMDERLFIDFVDQQWCWKAALKKKSCIMLPGQTISHELGVATKFLGVNISVSSPFRIYYQTRNLLWLCRKDYVPSFWKKKNLAKLFFKFFYYSAIPRQRLLYCRRMLSGIVDGFSDNL